MPMIALDHLDSHPDNANCMSAALFEKLQRHMRETGNYPPLIVRPVPRSDRFEILDGHHRARALRELGHEEARCEVWHVNDEQAAMLLLTLNRLHGEDNPQKRGALLEKLSLSMEVDSIARLVPDDVDRIHRLIASTHPPEPIGPPQSVHDLLLAVTFFLNELQRRRLFAALGAICRDRNQALVRILELDDRQ